MHNLMLYKRKYIFCRFIKCMNGKSMILHINTYMFFQLKKRIILNTLKYNSQNLYLLYDLNKILKILIYDTIRVKSFEF